MNSPTPAELRPKTFMGKVGMTVGLVMMSPMLADDPNGKPADRKKAFWGAVKWIWTGKEPKK